MNIKFSEWVALIASAKPCCVTIWAFTALSTGGSSVGPFFHNVDKFLLVFVALPSLLYVHYRLWNGLRVTIKNNVQVNWKLLRFNVAIVCVSTVIFGYFAFTNYAYHYFYDDKEMCRTISD